MKYRNFRNIVALVLFASLGGTCYGCYGCWQRALAQEEADRRTAQKAFEEQRAQDEAAAAAAALAEARRAAEVVQSSAADAAMRTKTPGAYWSRAPGLRAIDKEVLLVLDRPVVEKIKDASSGKPYKINAYSDDKKRFNRLKIDLDRDEKADESWTIKDDGSIERKVAERDDEKYNQSLRLDIMNGWMPNNSVAVPVAGLSEAIDGIGLLSHGDPGPALRAVDRDMLALLKGPVKDKIKDGTPGKRYKINLYSDDGNRFNRAKIDLNRNDKWDESWTFNVDGSIEIKAAPLDDENYTQVRTVAGGPWQH